MNTEAGSEPSGPWQWPVTDPSDWVRAWTALLPPWPENLTQPILPGWTVGPVLTINAANSSEPQTEAEIVQRHSYGRQLGRIADALAGLIEERGPAAPTDERFAEFIEMKTEIDRIKLDAADTRIERLVADLAALKQSRPEDYRRLRDRLRSALEG